MPMRHSTSLQDSSSPHPQMLPDGLQRPSRLSQGYQLPKFDCLLRPSLIETRPRKRHEFSYTGHLARRLSETPRDSVSSMRLRAHR